MSPTYQEHPAPVVLSTTVACLWEHRPTTDHVQRIIPDGCVDLIWLAERELVVAGADTGPRTVELPAGLRSTGIRLRPGAAGPVLGLPASEVRDRQVDASAVWGALGARLGESIADADPEQRLTLLADAVAGRGAEPDALVVEAARRLAQPGARVAGVADSLGVGERQLHRRTVSAVGYPPKMLARVARLRRLTRIGGRSPLAERAVAAGFSSQAHMSDDVRRLTGLTAVRFLEDATSGPG